MNHGPTLTTGSAGPDVRRLQRLFVMMKGLEPSGIDGVFGHRTEHAVESFQKSEGLAVDGIVGVDTWAALPADPGTRKLSEGDSGPIVKAVQKVLREYRGHNTPTDPGSPDGVFGPRTESAVRAYQGDVGVHVDGVVGDQTWWAPAGAAGATLASLAGLTTV